MVCGKLSKQGWPACLPTCSSSPNRTQGIQERALRSCRALPRAALLSPSASDCVRRRHHCRGNRVGTTGREDSFHRKVPTVDVRGTSRTEDTGGDGLQGDNDRDHPLSNLSAEHRYSEATKHEKDRQREKRVPGGKP